jgi:uncharacterized protein (DUF2062 family)
MPKLQKAYESKKIVYEKVTKRMRESKPTKKHAPPKTKEKTKAITVIHKKNKSDVVLNEKWQHSKVDTPKHKNWFVRKYEYVVKIIKNLLTQGISPEKIAMAIAAGFIAGTFPLLGTHTLIGIALGFIFGLNQVAVYLGAWLSFPLYFFLLLPSLRVGEYIARANPMNMDGFLEGLKIMFKSPDDFFNVWTHYGYSIVHILIGWIPFVVVISFCAYLFTLFFARMITQKKK